MTGLENKEINQNYSFLKGRLGEAITEQIFIQLGYKVLRYGIENTIPGISSEIKNLKGSVIESIRNQPDFVVHSANGEWLFLEVKYRKDLNLNVKQLLRYEHPDIQFIIITPGFIGAISKNEVEELSEKGLKTITKIKHLSDNDLFKFNANDKILVSQFEIYTKAFFSKLPSFSEICEQANEYV